MQYCRFGNVITYFGKVVHQIRNLVAVDNSYVLYIEIVEVAVAIVAEFGTTFAPTQKLVHRLADKRNFGKKRLQLLFVFVVLSHT